MMMKKIASKVALKTIGYCLPGNAKVKIVAYRTREQRLWGQYTPETLWEGLWVNFSDTDNYDLFKAHNSAVERLELETDPCGNVLMVFTVVLDD